MISGSHNDESTDNVRLISPIKIRVPAIVCEGCVLSLTKILEPYVLQQDMKYIQISYIKKCIKIIPAVEFNSDTLIEAIIDAGYADPHPYEIRNGNSLKIKNRPLSDDEDIKIDHGVVHDDGSKLYFFQVDSANSTDCIDFLQQKLATLNLDVMTNHTMEKQICIKTDPTIVDHFQLMKQLHNTGHQFTALDANCAKADFDNKKIKISHNSSK